MHQLVEFLLGGAMVASGLQSPTPVVPSVIGALMMVHAAITIGPLAAFRVLPRRIHRVTDVVLIAVNALAAVQPWIKCEAGSRVIVGMIAVIHAFVWWRTSFTEPVTRRERAAAREAARPLSPSELPDDRATNFGRKAGRLAGRGVQAAKAAKAAKAARDEQR